MGPILTTASRLTWLKRGDQGGSGGRWDHPREGRGGLTGEGELKLAEEASQGFGAEEGCDQSALCGSRGPAEPSCLFPGAPRTSVA